MNNELDIANKNYIQKYHVLLIIVILIFFLNKETV